MREQFWMHEPLAHQDAERWRDVARHRLMPMFEEMLQREGVTPRYAPDMPPCGEGWQGFIDQPYRVLKRWIPLSAPSPLAGRHVVRVDTIA